MTHSRSCSVARGNCLDQGLNAGLFHCQVDSFFMVSGIGFLGKSLSTYVAFIRPLSCVCSLVFDKICFVDECFGTVVTAVGFLSSVNFFMLKVG